MSSYGCFIVMFFPSLHLGILVLAEIVPFNHVHNLQTSFNSLNEDLWTQNAVNAWFGLASNKPCFKLY